MWTKAWLSVIGALASNHFHNQCEKREATKCSHQTLWLLVEKVNELADEVYKQAEFLPCVWLQERNMALEG